MSVLNRIGIIGLIIAVMAGIGHAQAASKERKEFNFSRFSFSAGTKSYRSYTRVDNSKKIGPPYFTSMLPSVNASYIFRNSYSEHRISAGYGFSSSLNYDDGMGNNNVNNSSSSSYFTIPLEYSYLFFAFRTNPNIAFGPVVTFDYTNEDIMYLSSDRVHDKYYRTGIGITSLLEILFGEKLKFTAEYINQITMKSFSSGVISYDRKYAGIASEEDYDVFLTNSAVKIMMDYRITGQVSAGAGFQWEEFFGSAKTSVIKLHDISYRYLDLFTYINYNF